MNVSEEICCLWVHTSPGISFGFSHGIGFGVCKSLRIDISLGLSDAVEKLIVQPVHNNIIDPYFVARF
jgi:hypothetical protein